jgi:hypothetical protein
MPTGYTADVENGKVTDLRTFVLLCSRAFGACIMQREDAMDAPPKYRNVEPYYAEHLARAEVKRDRLAGMTLDEAYALEEAEYWNRLAAHEQSVARTTEEINRYNEMLAKVMGWAPPTPEHEGLKKFMVHQLVESKRFHEYTLPTPTRKSAKAWLGEKRAKAAKDVAYYAQSKLDEEKRVTESNEWIRQLYESLNGVPA